jgi:glyoxylase-like metal-dependent hydrolase (beta-lactamase superfamily II)
MIRRVFPVLVFLSAAALCLFQGSAHSAEKGSGLYSMKLGDLRITVLEDGSGEMNSSLFRNADPAVLKKLMPDGKAPASVNVFLIKTGKKNILVDAGNGTGGARKGNLLALLKKAGIAPADIDILLLTHIHLDHVGGLLDKGKPAFARARVMLSGAESEMISEAGLAAMPADGRAYFAPARTALDAYKGRIDFIKPGDRIAEGVTAVDLSGHTAGHTGFLVESDGQKLLLAGDILHVAAVQFARPEYCLVYDSDPDRAAAMRKKILKRAADEKIIIAGAHIPFPGMVQVKEDKQGFGYTPIK